LSAQFGACHLISKAEKLGQPVQAWDGRRFQIFRLLLTPYKNDLKAGFASACEVIGQAVPDV
jgi:hypothetical protein